MLLPQITTPTLQMPQQLLSTHGGCYHWTSSSPKTLAVSPHPQNLSQECSAQALVEVIQTGPFPSSVYLTASDPSTLTVLNIPARIRQIHSIFIATKSRMMNIQEVQKLELYAHDSEGNTFTSLEGLRFSWKLDQTYSILEKVRISQAGLLLPLITREKIEQEGYQSDILVVKALAPGNLKVTATCIEPGYTHLQN